MKNATMCTLQFHPEMVSEHTPSGLNLAAITAANEIPSPKNGKSI